MVNAFGWSTGMLDNNMDFLALILVEHPFKGTKATVWLATDRVFLWNLFGERNIGGFNI